MKIITHEAIMDLHIEPLQCLNWVQTMLREKGHTVLKPKISLKFNDNNFYNTMPAMLPGSNVFGVKEVSRYPDRFPSLDSQILLYDLKSGVLKALMDGNYITTMRTGAVAAAAIQLLAKKDFYEIGMIGLGNTARATMKVLLAMYPNREFHVKLKKYKDQHEKFVHVFAPQAPHVKFSFSDSYEDVVCGSDVVISSVTFAEKNFCPDNCYQPGCLVVPIHTRGFQNCDLFFDKVFADDRGHVEGFQYFDKFKQFAELSDVITGRSPGRTSDNERILSYNIGIAIHDIYFAEKIYELETQQSDVKNPQVKLNHLKDKFWVK